MLALPFAAQSQDWQDIAQRPQDVLGSLSCASVTCHGRVEPRNFPGAASQQEYLHWLGGQPSYVGGLRHYDPRARIAKDYADPHALAARRMTEPRFQEVLRRASHLPDGQVDPRIYAKCAACHDPLSLVPASSLALTPALSHREREDMRGIGCESCHGGARRWIATHYQRDVSRQQLIECGMIDTKNVLTRARLCAACHVGWADQDMNHDMIAAGHPPLRFEMASHQALIERKHWDDAPRRLAEPNYEVQLWAAGRIASADAALALLESRAGRASGGHAPWPEFAESNCFACHQPLRPSVEQPAALTIRRGTATWQAWNVALSSSIVPALSLGEHELPPPALGFAASLQRVREQMASTWSPRASEVAQTATAARKALRDQVRVSPTGEILGPDGQVLGVTQVAAMLVQQRSPSEISWEEYCHELATVLAAERALRDAFAQKSAQGAITAEELSQGMADCEGIRQRAKLVANALRFTSEKFEWPAVLDHRGGDGSLAQIAAEIKALAEKIREIGSSTEY